MSVAPVVTGMAYLLGVFAGFAILAGRPSCHSYG
jgi:hypothetical protein